MPNKRTYEQRLAHIQEMHRKRHEALRLHREEGWTLQAIGDQMGLTRERIRQMVEEAEREIRA